MSPEKIAVDVHSRLTVVSSTPTEPCGSTHALSPLDHAMGSHSVHVIFYYRTSPFTKTGRFAMDLDTFRISLSDLLSKYPRMTGRLARDGYGNWEAKYNDAGVRMLKAKVGSTVDEWLRCADESNERNLTVWDDMVDGDPSWSPFLLQLNEFEGGGVAIGLSFTHLLADPTSATLFFKSWTEVGHGEPIGHQPPIFHLPNLDTQPSPAGNISATTKYFESKSKLGPTPPVKMATSTFKFSDSIINQHLSKIKEKCPDATPFDFLAAFFWIRIVTLKAPNKDMPTHSLSMCLDPKKLCDMPVEAKFFGNALHFSKLSLSDKILTREDGLAEAVESVHDHVSGIKKEDFVSFIDWLESRKLGENGEYPKPFQMYGPELTCISMEHLMIPKEGEMEPLVSEAKFKKNEKPVHVSYRLGNSEGEGLILIMPSPEGGLARTVKVSLPVDEIAKLNEDQVLLELEPTTILSSRR